MTAAGSLTCTATHRVVHRILGDTTAERTKTTMTSAAGFAEDHVFVFGITDLADRRETVLVDAPDFARRQTELRITFIARHQSRATARRTNHLTAFARS